VPSRFTTDDMSFTSFFSTEAPRAVPEPLIATDALQSLVAPEIAEPLISAYAPITDAPVAELQPLDLELGFVPLPAPLPLAPPEAVQQPEDLMAGTEAQFAANDGMPKARVLMTGEPTNLFLTQLIGQQ
jgi:hypothetical protein